MLPIFAVPHLLMDSFIICVAKVALLKLAKYHGVFFVQL